MRQHRSSGSVEGVVGNHDSYSDSVSGCTPPQISQLLFAAIANFTDTRGGLSRPIRLFFT